MYADKLEGIRLCVCTLAAELHTVGLVRNCACAYTAFGNLWKAGMTQCSSRRSTVIPMQPI